MEANLPIWVVLKEEYADHSNDVFTVIVKSFTEKGKAIEWYYMAYMQEILERNRFGSFDSYMRLESYDNILDAIVNKHVEIYKDPNICELESRLCRAAEDDDDFVGMNAEYTELFDKFARFKASSNVYIDACLDP
jgi:hypothetical protein